MVRKEPLSDNALLKQVTQSLTRGHAGGQSRITASVRNGDVTLVGTIRYEHQRRPIVGSVSSTSGIRRVIDQMRVEAKKNNWG